jgi:hypothetical protein
MNRAGKLLSAGLVALTLAAESRAAETKRFGVEIESGPVWQSRNDVRIPSDTGTQFSLRDIQGSGPFAFGRATVDYAINPKHELRFLVAPLSLAETGPLAQDTLFAGRAFVAGTDVEAAYRFNSYRLTYRYRIYEGERWKWKIGATGKIRDARIELRQNGISAVDKNVGFVPLLHLDGEYRWADRWSLNLNMDGLAAPQGRAFDVALKVRYDLSKNWTLSAGYRMLEGGADTDEVYTFAWLHYAAVSINFRF